MARRVVIVGAGLGGLATALRLSHDGDDVLVLEKTGQIGGRNRREFVGECQFDGGPTLMMMLDPFRRLFADVGERMEDQLSLSLCDPGYRVFWADGMRLDATPNQPQMAARIREIFGPEDAAGFERLMKDLAGLYRESIPNFVERNYNSPLDLVSPKSISLVLKHGMLGNLAKRMERYVRDPRLRMLFSFQTMYLGLSPYEAIWVYAVLTYMEYGEGIWYPQGGLPQITDTVAKLAQARGAEIRLNSPVAKIENSTIWLEGGETVTADKIVVNADLPYAEKKLLRSETRRKRTSCSAVMTYIDYEGEMDRLLHHNVFFGPDFRGNLDAIFADPPRMADNPAFYVSASCRTEPGLAPPGRLNLSVLVPCPNLDGQFDVDKMRTQVFRRLTDEVGFDPTRIRAMKATGPQEWAQELNLDRGAAFGLSAHFGQSVCFRPSNVSKSNPKVFYVGASTVPGNGLPMVLISAELVQKRLREAPGKP